MTGTDAKGSYGALLRNPAFVRVFSAGVASVAGGSVAFVCLIWIVYARTGSPLAVAFLGTSNLVAVLLFSVLGGAWADRFDRRTLMVVADLARAGAIAVVLIDLLLGGFDLAVILGASFVVGAFSVVFTPAEQAILPSLVPAGSLADANGLVSSSRSAVQLLGSATAGALIVTVGATAGIAVNVATFLLSAALLFGLPRTGRPSPQGAAASGYLAEIAAGFRWLYGAKGFFQLTVSATFFNFCRSIVSAFLVVFATRALGGSALVFSGLLAADVAGLGIGSLMVGRLGAVRYAGRAWVVPYGVVSGTVTVGLALLPSVPFALVALFALGVFGGFAGTAWLSAAQLLVPPEMQGRYFGVDNLGSVAIVPAAEIGGALLIQRYGILTTFFGVGLFWVAAGLVFLIPRALWELGARPAPVAPPRPTGDGARR